MKTGLEFHGRLIIETFDESTKTAAGKWEADNTICINGLTDVAAAISYLGVQDIAADIGTTPVYITPIYGAVGNGDIVTTPPSLVDTALVNEISRSTASASGYAPALGSNPGQVVWQFQFPINNSGSNYTITEAGVFVQASETTGSGDLFDHAVFSPSAQWLTNQSMILSLQLSLYPVAW